jgi:molecular chaperone DnaK
VVLTDGQWFRQDAAEHSAKACYGDEIGVVAIGFGSADWAFLQRIASTDEAGLFTDLSRLVETFESVAQIITSGAGIAPATDSGSSGGRTGGLLARLKLRH